MNAYKQILLICTSFNLVCLVCLSLYYILYYLVSVHFTIIIFRTIMIYLFCLFVSFYTHCVPLPISPLNVNSEIAGWTETETFRNEDTDTIASLWVPSVTMFSLLIRHALFFPQRWFLSFYVVLITLMTKKTLFICIHLRLIQPNGNRLNCILPHWSLIISNK